MISAILFRNNISLGDEMEVAAQYFPVYGYRSDPCRNFVIPRYSSLPFYNELEYDLDNRACELIQSHAQHRYIADFSWYWDCEDLTPRTWFGDLSHCRNYDGPFVVKGQTNSRKYQWNSHMYAGDRRAASLVASNLTNDSLVGTQPLIFREYVPLKRLGTGLYDLPFSSEYRCFFLGERLLCAGFYWSTHDFDTSIEVPAEAIQFAKKCAKRLASNTNFFVVDVAEKESGGYILIEVNCATMSGLSECDPHKLYGGLKAILEHEH